MPKRTLVPFDGHGLREGMYRIWVDKHPLTTPMNESWATEIARMASRRARGRVFVETVKESKTLRRRASFPGEKR